MGSSEPKDGWNGAFIIPLEGQMWQVRCSDGMDWKHVSVTNHQVKRLPDWKVMCRIRDLFFADEVWVVQYHPAASDYINDHPFVLHLWQPLREVLPIPGFWMV